MLLQVFGDLAKLPVRRRHHLFEIRDRLRRADAGHHVLALRVDQELAVENFFAGRRIAREADAGRRGFAQIAEHHRLHVRRGADVVRNLFHLAVVRGLGIPPGTEHRVARHRQLILRVLRKRLLGFLLDQLLIIVDDGFQIFRGQIRVRFHLGLMLCASRKYGRIFHLDVQRHFAEHLDKSPIRVIGEARIGRLLGHPFHRLVIQTQVQNRVHHPGHRKLRAGADAHQQRTLRIAQPLPDRPSEYRQRGEHWSLISLGTLLPL